MAGIAEKNRRRLAAYRATFNGNGTKEEAGLVLADLADFTGFYKVADAEATDAVLRHHAGQRSVFGRILAALRMTDAELLRLEEAARREAFNLSQGDDA